MWHFIQMSVIQSWVIFIMSFWNISLLSFSRVILLTIILLCHFSMVSFGPIKLYSSLVLFSCVILLTFILLKYHSDYCSNKCNSAECHSTVYHSVEWHSAAQQFVEWHFTESFCWIFPLSYSQIRVVKNKSNLVLKIILQNIWTFNDLQLTKINITNKNGNYIQKIIKSTKLG